MVELSKVWARVESLEKTSDAEAGELLAELLADLGAREGGADDALFEIGRVVASALHRVDHRGDDRAVILDELRADGKHAEALNEYLLRLMDPEHPQRFRGATDALEALDEVWASLPGDEGDAPATPAPEFETPRAAAALPPFSAEDNSARNRRVALAMFVLILILPVVLLARKVLLENSQARHPVADEAVAGTTVEFKTVAAAEELRMGATWARASRGASSNGDRMNGVLSWPDAYRDENVSDSGAWYARYDNDGLEWLEVLWNYAVDTEAIVVVEAGTPGAVIAVDDILEPQTNSLQAKNYVRLWQGRLPVAAGNRVAVFHFRAPRAIEGIRLVLDTSLAEGRNRIDAIGLLPERD